MKNSHVIIKSSLTYIGNIILTKKNPFIKLFFSQKNSDWNVIELWYSNFFLFKWILIFKRK